MKKGRPISYTFLFSFVISGLIIALFIRPGDRYVIHIHQEEYFSKRSSTTFYSHDLNSDGNTERVHAYQPLPESSALVIYTSEGEIIDQFNFQGKIPVRSRLEFLDVDKDSLTECYLFTYSGDSLFLNSLEPLDRNFPNKKLKFIDIAPLEDGIANYDITNLVYENMPDGSSHIYFAVNAGFALQPRRVYAYDITNDSLIKSPFAGSGPRAEFRSFDIDQDGTAELYGKISASGNYDVAVPYTDQKSWFMVFSHTLDFEFPPVPYASFPSQVMAYPVQGDTMNYWMVLFDYYGQEDTISSHLSIYTKDGKQLKYKDLSSYNILRAGSFFYQNKLYLTCANSGIILQFDQHLQQVSKESHEHLEGMVLSGPFLFENMKEPVLIGQKLTSVYFLDLKGRILCSQTINGLYQYANPPANISNYKGKSGFQLDLDDRSVIASLEKQKRWLWFSLKVAAIVIVVTGLFYLLQYLMLRQEKKRSELRNQLREYQLIAIKKQVDPHFIFNALNAISSMNMSGQADKAEMYLSNFSSLMREVLKISDKNIISLSAELELINSYLELENIRLGKDFHYTVSIPDNCMGLQIPSMSVFTFVENAIKHGLAPKKGEKVLLIEAECNEDEAVITVEDNGEGFNVSSKSKYKNGRGLDIVRKMFFAYHQLTGKSISYRRTDKPTGGARITISVEL